VSQTANARVWLFSYGTLRNPQVQIAVFGRRITGRPDALPGYSLSTIEITDPSVISASGETRHPIITATGNGSDQVEGSVFEITPADLEAADKYEVGDYQRLLVRLKRESTLGPTLVEMLNKDA
jgi:gamma-glutamyl AIG2-like cyclotransferase